MKRHDLTNNNTNTITKTIDKYIFRIPSKSNSRDLWHDQQKDKHGKQYLLNFNFKR